MSFGALYLAASSALFAQRSHVVGLDREQPVAVFSICGVLLTAGCVLLILAQVPT